MPIIISRILKNRIKYDYNALTQSVIFIFANFVRSCHIPVFLSISYSPKSEINKTSRGDGPGHYIKSRMSAPHNGKTQEVFLADNGLLCCIVLNTEDQ